MKEFHVEYLGGPKDGLRSIVPDNCLPGVMKIMPGFEVTELGDADKDFNSCAVNIGNYYLKPMRRSNGVRFFIYVYEDALDEFERRYASSNASLQGG